MKAQAKFFGLAAFALLWGLAFTAYYALTPERQPPGFHWLAIINVTWPALATWTAAATFGWRDRMRWAWALRAILFTIGIATKLVRPDEVTPVNDWVMILLTINTNVLAVISQLLFVLAWSESGLIPPWRNWAILGCVIVGVAVAGPPVWVNAGAALQGNGDAAVLCISALGDIATIALLGPLLASAWWLRGGVIMWPYLFLVGESIVWLIYDFSSLFSPETYERFSTVTPFFGWAFVGVAAIAHRWVVRGARQ